MTVIVAVDGSDESLQAVRAGLQLLQPVDRPVVVTVVEASDPSLVTGTGFASGVMSSGEFEAEDARVMVEGQTTAEAAVASLDLDAEVLVLRGSPGPLLCQLAEERGAGAIVMGTRGRGGLKRALLGSVSDHVVRNAPCPVVIARPLD
jgi:nucleotide-binding universal stress UspA family protein